MPLINLNLWEGENKLHREIILPQSERQDLINKTKSGLIPLVPALLRKKARRQGDFCGSEVLYKANQGYTVRPSFKKKKRRNTGRNEGCGQKELLQTVGGNVNYGSWCRASKWPSYLKYSTSIHHRGSCISMFIVALFIVAESLNQPRCLTTEEWIKKCGIYTQGNFFLATESNAICKKINMWIEVFILRNLNQS